MSHKIVTVQGGSECGHCKRRLRSGSRAFGVATKNGEIRTYHHVCLECGQAGLVNHTPKQG